MSSWDWRLLRNLTFCWIIYSVFLCRERDQRARLLKDDADWLSGDGHQNPPHQKLTSSSLPPGLRREPHQHLLVSSSSPRGSPCCQHHPWVITIVTPWAYTGKLRMGPCQTGERVRENVFFARVEAENCLIIEFKRYEAENDAALFLTICLSTCRALKLRHKASSSLSRGIGGPAFFTAAWWRFFFPLYFSRITFPLYLFCV